MEWGIGFLVVFVGLIVWARDDTDAAVGGWIEVEWAEILRVGDVP